jgi:hypothetical protein
MTYHRHIRTLISKVLRHTNVSSSVKAVALALLTLFGSPKTVSADTLGPELICDQKAAHPVGIKCIE